MPFFSKVFKRDGAAKGKNNAVDAPVAPAKPKWEESWSRKEVAAEEIQELIHECTQELKSRALDSPFLLLPFRPGSDPIGSKSFIRNFFRLQYEGSWRQNRHVFEQELKLMDPLVLVSIMRWCWSRLPGGVVTWETYDLFKTGEIDADMDKKAFNTFMAMATESRARLKIVTDFFDLLAAIAARGKTNGLGGRKLSRMAGWWAFEHSDHGKGFDGGYHSWAKAADATSHLFFAYLRSLAPDDNGVSGISQLPRSLQALLSQTEYPPETPTLMLTTTPKVVMIVTSVSPTPFALLRRARNFEFRDDDEALQEFSSYEDPVKALTDECRRVISCVSNVNESVAKTNGGAPQDGSWSRFEDMGFSSLADGLQSPGDLATSPRQANGLRTQPSSNSGDFGRPTTPSWADFLSTGFPDENAPTLLPPEKSLPLPIGDIPRGHSSQSHVRNGLHAEDLEAGELASINQFDLDETFWWVWMTSLAGEETPARKSVFGRCALIETAIRGAHWLVIEEQIKGASPGQDEGVYLAEKKSRFSWTRRGRLGRKKTVNKKSQPSSIQELERSTTGTPSSRLAPDQHAKVRAAAAKLKGQKNGNLEGQRRGRVDESSSQKTNSVLTLQPEILSEAGPAMKWTKNHDRDAIRTAYLGDPSAGRGNEPTSANTSAIHIPHSPAPTTPRLSDRDLPALPKEPSSPIQRKPLKVQTPPATPPNRSDEDDSPMPTEPAFDEKPKLHKADKHPALRKDAQPEPAAEIPEPSSKVAKEIASREAAAASSSGGFKRLFGKKKTGDSAPVAPATESAPSPPHKLQKSPPKGPPKSVPIHIDYQPEPTPEPIAKESPPAQVLDRQITHPAAAAYRDPSPPAVITEREQRDAEKEFSRFDQGPLDDVPAFVPDSSPEASVKAPSPMPQQTSFPPPAPVEPAPVVPAPAPAPLPATAAPAPAQSERTGRVAPMSRLPIAPRVEGSRATDAQAADSSSNPANDRWAQIRANAAARAQRMNQQQEESRRSTSQSARTDKTDTDKTEDGDTSGEETIESRVARIKARVAELTGNMDAPPASGARR